MMSASMMLYLYGRCNPAANRMSRVPSGAIMDVAYRADGERICLHLNSPLPGFGAFDRAARPECSEPSARQRASAPKLSPAPERTSWAVGPREALFDAPTSIRSKWPSPSSRRICAMAMRRREQGGIEAGFVCPPARSSA